MHSAVVGAERIDHGTMRTINLALLLGALRSEPISRAELSRRTHLSKASITNLAAELAARGLVREGSPDRNGTVGRPGTMLTLEGARVCGVGLEINAEYLAVCVVDLCGTVLYDRAQPFDVASLPISDVLDEVAGIMRDTLEQLHSARRHVAQVMVSAPGVIKQPAGTVHLASNLGWRDVPLRSQLLQRLDADISLQVENDAKLAAVAEYRRYEDSDVRDLVYLSGDIGVGAGIIAAGRDFPEKSGTCTSTPATYPATVAAQAVGRRASAYPSSWRIPGTDWAPNLSTGYSPKFRIVQPVGTSRSSMPSMTWLPAWPRASAWSSTCSIPVWSSWAATSAGSLTSSFRR